MTEKKSASNSVNSGTRSCDDLQPGIITVNKTVVVNYVFIERADRFFSFREKRVTLICTN